MPEVKNNLDMTTGKLGLTDQEENQIVAFLQTLTDGFTRPYPNRDTLRVRCMTGGSAATQGNESLSRRRRFRPAHRLSAASRLSPVRLFRSGKTPNGGAAVRAARHRPCWESRNSERVGRTRGHR